MARLAIIGGGIVGKSLLFSLAKEKRQKYDSVTLFTSDTLAPACTLRSTAIVAARGVLPGLSPLGDMIHQGIHFFNEHVRTDSPVGVYPVTQVSSAFQKKDAFFRRYQNYQDTNHFKAVHFSEVLPVFTESAFYVKPDEYCDWLLQKSEELLNLKVVNDFVTQIDEEGNLKTANGLEESFDHIIIAGGVKNNLWSGLLHEPKLKKAKSVRGSFLLFKNFSLFNESYSLSIDDINLIFRFESKELIIGSTSKESRLYEFDDREELKKIYQFFQKILVHKLPDIGSAEVLIGMREKAPKREPYSGTEGKISYLGGLYKNGFTLSLKMASELVGQLP